VFTHLFYRHIADDQARRQAMLREEALDAGLSVHVYGGGAGDFFVRLQPLGSRERADSGYQGVAATLADALTAALTLAKADRGWP
jgi:hypothetical protein